MSQIPELQLLTWNIDAFSESHDLRMEGILSEVRRMVSHDSGPDIVFFQEVSREALAYLLRNHWVRETWILSEVDETNWANVSFATVTLLSRFRFGSALNKSGRQPEVNTSSISVPNDGVFSLGPVWRVKYPSRYGRDALCCDILWNKATSRIRLINVHLDSLRIEPSKRPRQAAIAASLLRTAGVGRGVIAGDWNPVLDEDKDLVQANGLVDAWEYLHPEENGFTWGLDGKRSPLPPTRLDKVAILGLTIVDIRVVHPGTVTKVMDAGLKEGVGQGRVKVPWSDHSGLVCRFSLEGAS
ncbi:hypothetical protein N0V93_008902 [Gnomoniopsis smithogilvyi]|uniref:Endonuclease/exonuclease/phosphatase domain-containing protein n=1 Tax=Gnomoniopsis smithogilvyi TaxID=1191159 RepID=A0A9W8YK39_9PEZI|nr:hypothetical protein N0V93_008902 [Gnomoniopsis smithogilvyi]